MEHMRYILDQADTRLHSWTYWQYKYYNDVTTAARPSELEGLYNTEGTLIQSKVSVLARPYILSSSLPILYLKFDHYRTTLRAVLDNKSHLKSASVDLYLNEDFYFKTGAQCTVEGCKSCKLMKSALIAGTEDLSRHHYTIDLSERNANAATLRITCK